MIPTNDLKGLKVYIETYGCWLNKGETEIMITLLTEKGADIVASPNNANIIIINTCAVRGDTEVNMLKRIKYLYNICKKRRSKLIVTGCLARIRPSTILKLAPKASLISPDYVEHIVDFVKEEQVIKLLETPEKRKIMPKYRGGIRYIAPVQSGCLGNCTFCVGKVARRKLKSYPPDAIINAVKNAVERGAKEIFITGQDVASYGYDIGTNIVELLNELLDRVEGNYKIRIGMMEPSLVLKHLDGLIEIYKDERVYKYLHVPVQSLDNEVLKLMNRKYTYEDFKYLVEEFRRHIKDITIATDLIVGFPGESEKAFMNTYERLLEIQPDKVHVARYTLRPFTKAAYMKQIPSCIINTRLRLIMERVFTITALRNLRFVNKVFKVLITDPGYKPGSLISRMFNYKPVILMGSKEFIGKEVKSKIVGCTPIDLRGVILS